MFTPEKNFCGQWWFWFEVCSHTWKSIQCHISRRNAM